jgi:hypothetical protein
MYNGINNEMEMILLVILHSVGGIPSFINLAKNTSFCCAVINFGMIT